MTLLTPTSLETFRRQYHWKGAVLRALRVTHQRQAMNMDLVLKVKPLVKSLDAAVKPVRLHLRCVDVEECRIQKRVGTQLKKLANLHFAFLQGQFFLTLDDWSLGAAEKPAI